MTVALKEVRQRFEDRWPLFLVPAEAAGSWSLLCRALERASVPPPCREEPELWFAPGTSARVEEAVAGCRVCPVLHLCAAYALAADERSGVWGGLTEAERRALRGGVR